MRRRLHRTALALLVALVLMAIGGPFQRPALARAAPPSPRGDARPASSPIPRGLGFEDGPIGTRRDAFFVPTPGWQASLIEDRPALGARCARLVRLPDAADGGAVGNLMGFVDAEPYRGRRVALTSKVRVAGDPAAQGQAQMWLRVDRPEQRPGAFDNMSDRPIRSREWTAARIEQDVAADAITIAIGWLCLEGATGLDVDDVELRVVGDAIPEQAASPPRPLSPRELESVVAAARLVNLLRFFHPSDQCIEVRHWDRVAIDLIEQAEPAGGPADLADRLAAAIAPLAPTVQLWAGTPEDAPPEPAFPEDATGLRSWRHHGAGRIGSHGGGGIYRSMLEDSPLATPIDPEARRAAFAVRALGGGVSCRVPLKVAVREGTSLPLVPLQRGGQAAGAGRAAPERYFAEAAPEILTLANRSTRLAAVSLAWGVFQHFYPYFDVVDVDWAAQLPSALSQAAIDADELAAVDTLAALVAGLRDGHGRVHSNRVGARAMLPLALRWCGDALVVVGRAEDAPPEVVVGDVVLSIDGRSSDDLLVEAARTISAATEGWRRHVAPAVMANTVARRAQPGAATLRLRRPDGTEHEIAAMPVPPRSIPVVCEHRPPNGTEVAPGIVYFNLDGTDEAALQAAMPAISAAKGLVLDLRGYPNRAAYLLLEHLLDQPAQSARWIIPVVTRPDQEGMTWFESGRWNMQPRQPRIGVPVAFLTDGRAISYAESIMGIVEAYDLGEIVGETTAGTNGNVNPFTLPGDVSVSWTGMKVLKHDGSPHHGVGIAPTVPVVPTPRGISEGRDEVLERAIEVLKGRIGGAG